MSFKYGLTSEDKLQDKNVLIKKSETVNDMIFAEHNYSNISKCKKLSNKEKLSESSICVQKIQKLNPKEKSITNKLKWAYQNLKFFVLNVGGLKSKLKTEDIFESINSFHIVCFLEAKIDKVDLEGLKNKFDGFELFANVEAEFSNKPRGGIILLIKKELSPFITHFPNKSNMAIWCKVDKRILVGEKHLLCGFVYLPPPTPHITL